MTAPAQATPRRPVLHFFPRFSRAAADTPYNDHLRATGANYRIIASDVGQTYRRRWQLLVFGYPRLFVSALRSAGRSMLPRTHEPPDAVIISSDVEVLACAIVRFFTGRRTPRIVFMPFIFTARPSPQQNAARRLYYNFILRFVWLAICHSRLEVQRYREIFPAARSIFTFVPWGTHVPSVAEITASGAARVRTEPGPVAAAAGRSGRDYATFVAAARQAGCHSVIVCNDEAALRGVPRDASVTILRECFGLAYLLELLHADIVVVPLSVDDISAGQMVLIQAMALGKPLIVTQTPTIGDYLTDDKDALLVSMGDADQMARALTRLCGDENLRQRLGAQAKARYRQQFSGAAHAANVVAAVESQLPR